MMCDALNKKDDKYIVNSPTNIMMILPIKDGALRRLTGRSQRKVYTLCSKHLRVLTMMFDDYVNGEYKPGKGG